MDAQARAFEDMIEALGQLKIDILEACETMSDCSTVCSNEMNEDDLSSNATERVNSAVSNLRNKTLEITNLQMELTRRRDDLDTIEGHSSNL